MGILAWILIGLIAGWLAHVILGGRGGILYNLAVGLVGAIVGGFIFSKAQHRRHAGFLGQSDHRHHRRGHFLGDLAGDQTGRDLRPARGRLAARAPQP